MRWKYNGTRMVTTRSLGDRTLMASIHIGVNEPHHAVVWVVGDEPVESRQSSFDSLFEAADWVEELMGELTWSRL
jgi:hypothetical protein